MRPKTKVFDPSWRDDIYDIEAIDMKLILPNDFEREQGKDIWVMSQRILSETIFGKEYRYAEIKTRKAIVKSSISNDIRMVNVKTNEVLENSFMLDIFFPPKAWMTDSAEERCMMFAAAKEASGDVFVGGLGLGIYPQMVLNLKRPINSITIIENNPVIIDIIKESWVDTETRTNISIIEADIEDYLQNSDRLYDTIFLDTWEDADSRCLANVNYLIDLAMNISKDSSRIRCWGYALMVDTFIKEINLYEERELWDMLLDRKTDPILNKFVQWRTKEKDRPTKELLEEMGREIALNTSARYKNKGDYFTPYSNREEIMQNMNK